MFFFFSLAALVLTIELLCLKIESEFIWSIASVQIDMSYVIASIGLCLRSLVMEVLHGISVFSALTNYFFVRPLNIDASPPLRLIPV